jgi:hypothetical protein
VDTWWKRDPDPPARLQQPLGAEHVGGEEPLRVEHREAVVRLGGEVHHDVDAVLPQQRLDGRQVTDVAVDEGDPLAHAVQVGGVAGVRQRVQRDDAVGRVPAGPVVDEVRADEAGRAGDEQVHGFSSRVRERR